MFFHFVRFPDECVIFVHVVGWACIALVWKWCRWIGCVESYNVLISFLTCSRLWYFPKVFVVMQSGNVTLSVRQCWGQVFTAQDVVYTKCASLMYTTIPSKQRIIPISVYVFSIKFSSLMTTCGFCTDCCSV